MTQSRIVLLAVFAASLASSCGSSTAVEHDDGGSGGNGGVSDAGPDADACDADGDGYLAVACGGDDCADEAEAIHPGAFDTCDGDDNDCDGTPDQDGACDCAEPPSAPGGPYTERVCLAGGWMWMGMAVTDPDAKRFNYTTTPAHRVFVSPYYLDAYEVTNRRYIECLDAGVCTLEPVAGSSKTWDRTAHETPEMLDLPFLGGSALNAEVFCQRLGGWLPTEAQWERAAAGLGDEPRPYPHGFSLPTCAQEYTKDCLPDPVPDFPPPQRVGLLEPNPEGVYDLGGNATELTADIYDPFAYAACPADCKNPCLGCPGSKWQPPKDRMYGHGSRGAAVGLRVDDDRGFARSQFRDFRWKDVPYPDVGLQGFRCAYPAEPVR